MTFEDLKTFLVLAQTCNFTRTAEYLYSTQSTVSYRIRRIEEQVGKRLFDRTTTGVELTPAGRHFLKYADSLDKLFNDSLQSMNIYERYKKKIALGGTESAWGLFLFPALTQYFKESTEISYSFTSDRTIQLIDMLTSDKLDLTITMLPVNNKNIVCQELLHNRILLVKHRDLEIGENVITKDNCHLFPFMKCDLGLSFNQWFNRTFSFESQFIEVEKFSLYLHLIKEKVGMGFVPERMVIEELKDGTLEMLQFVSNEPIPEESVYLSYNEHGPKEILEIAELIKNYTRRNYPYV